MHRHAWAPPALALLAILASVFTASSTALARPSAAFIVPGFVPAPGYRAEAIGISADTFAISPGGQFATATAVYNDAFVNTGSTFTIYNHASPRGRRVLASFHLDDLQFLGGMDFAGEDTLLVSENGRQSTVFAVSIATGQARPLVRAGTLRNVAQVRVRRSDGAIFAAVANRPGLGAVVRIANGGAVPFAMNLGTGYLGGLTFDAAGDVFVGDTRDPHFTGNPGQILGLSPSGSPLGSLDLTGGLGYDVYDITADRRSNFYATTGPTVTMATPRGSFPLGTFTGMFPFPTDIAVDPEGGVLVNGNYTDVGGIFRIVPVGPRAVMPLPVKAPARSLLERPFSGGSEAS